MHLQHRHGQGGTHRQPVMAFARIEPFSQRLFDPRRSSRKRNLDLAGWRLRRP